MRAVPRGADPIVIDGRLDETAWQRAEPSGDFIERTPTPGATPPVTDRLRALYDEDALYFAVELGAEPGQTPTALELRRDSFRIFSDDTVTLKFDVTANRRSTVAFGVNVAGARIDYVAVSSFRIEYDALWDVATAVTPNGWVAELRIPYVALGLPASQGARRIGLQVSHDHRARTATYDWSPMPPEFGPVAAVKYGDLVEIVAEGGGTPVAVIPFALARKTDSASLELDVGGDLRVRLGEDTFAELTVLTDFAEVDLDDAQVNLDRFQLFLPEKRPFFLSGLDTFEFGAEGEAQVFFSRRIGLDPDGGVIPLWTGAKLYGREGPLSFGALSVLTGDDGEARASHSVARVRYDVGPARMGAIAGVRVDLSGAADSDRPAASVGVDGQLRAFDDRFETDTFAAVTLPSSEDEVPGLAGRWSAQWRGERWQPKLSVLRVDEDFDPVDGFARQTDLLRSKAEAKFVTRWAQGWLERVTLGADGQLDTEAASTALRGRQVGATGELGLRGGYVLGAGVARKTDRVRDPFTLLNRLDVAADTYTGNAVEIWFNTPHTINPDGAVSFVLNDGLFGGRRTGAALTLTASATRHARLTMGADWSRVELPAQPRTDSLTLNSGVTLAASPALSLDLIGQANEVVDTTAGVARLRWRYLPGSDLFVVYRRQDAEFLGFSGGADWSMVIKASLRQDFAL